MPFSRFSLHPTLVSAAKRKGWSTPTPIQNRAIPVLCKENPDAVITAATGTGKTAAYLLPLLHHLLQTKPRGIQALILLPTRELCIQIRDVIRDLTGNRIPLAAVFGGSGIHTQKQALAAARIVMATPGRLRDLMERGACDLSRISHLVLDEADELFEAGFTEDLAKIHSHLPEDRTCWLVSATCPPALFSRMTEWVTDPVRLQDAPQGETGHPDALSHICHGVRDADRFLALLRVLDAAPRSKTIVFCPTRKETRLLTKKLVAAGFPAEALHGERSQPERNALIERMRQNQLSLLVTTNVAARGMDLPGITHVIHYRLPDLAETYTHRSGRTARAGASGTSVTLVAPEEIPRLQSLGAAAGLRFTPKPLPTQEEIFQQQMAAIKEVCNAASYPQTKADPLPASALSLFRDLTKEDLIQALLHTHFPRMAKSMETTENLDVPIHAAALAAPAATTTFFLGIGKLDCVTASDIAEFLAKKTGIRPSRIQVNRKREFSFITVDQEVAATLHDGVQEVCFKGKQLSLKEAKRKKETP